MMQPYVSWATKVTLTPEDGRKEKVNVRGVQPTVQVPMQGKTAPVQYGAVKRTSK